jgi:hypothetical protein
MEWINDPFDFTKLGIPNFVKIWMIAYTQFKILYIQVKEPDIIFTDESKYSNQKEKYEKYFVQFEFQLKGVTFYDKKCIHIRYFTRGKEGIA